MSSHTLAGERRLATARRGGMTVLGKVAVPKPLNLPSQRLENHGLDPSVEIVPKGTLSWGSRPSSSGSNAWISSSLSPNADGANTSPSLLRGRPSSSGGTRPSTAGSDRTHEPVASAWNSNSRPSSASGTLASDQSSSISLRPRSAETRPNSSQLSRFAEHVTESSVAWGPSSTAERLGVKSSKEDGFSLSSGDFPTLGSEKEITVKNFESQDGRPSSASGRITRSKERDIKSQADAEHGMLNEWRSDSSRFTEAGSHPSMEKWQGEPQQYFNATVAPHHFDAWRGPPVNASDGVWYRGQPRGPPFGAPAAPGGFPMEPFPYYRPQLPPPALAGSQSAPSGSGPRGPHPNMREFYSPQMPDAYAHPGSQRRPGFYHGPPGPMTFEGYFGPPMGYGKNERDISHLCITAGPTVYNGYPGSSGPNIGNSRGGKTISEHMEAVHLEDTRGPKRVPLKNDNEWDRKEEGENREHIIRPSLSYPGKSCLPMMASRKNEWGAEDDVEEDIFAKRTILRENSSHSFPRRDHSSGSKVKSEGTGNVKAYDDSWTNKSESVPRFAPGMPQLPLCSERNSSLLPATKDYALMPKIEGLNAIVRASDLSNDVPHSFNREEQMTRSKVDLKIKDNSGEGRDIAGSLERPPVSGDFVSVPQGVIGPIENKPIQAMAVLSRTPYHGVQGRVDHHLKGKNNNLDHDGWRKKPLTPESSSASIASNIESASSIHVQGPSSVGEAADIYAIESVGKVEVESVAETYNSTTTQAQRAKVRELAKQRALQLQKEEEERTREQKAKALAKLEELNRRTQASEAANQMAVRTQAIADKHGEQEELSPVGEAIMFHSQPQAPIPKLVAEAGEAANQMAERTQTIADKYGEQEESSSVGEAIMVHSQFQAPSTKLVSEAGEAANQMAERTQAILDKHGEQEELSQVGEAIMVHSQPHAPSTKLVSEAGVAVVDKDSSSSEAVESVEVSRSLPPDKPKTVLLESNLSCGHSLPMKEDADTVNARDVTSILDDAGTSRLKRVGYKQTKNSLLDKGSNEKSVSHLASAVQRDHIRVGSIDITLVEATSSELKPSGESNMQNTFNTVAEPSTERRKKVDSSSKSMHRVNDTREALAFPRVVSGVNQGKESIGNGEYEGALSNLDIPVSTVVQPDRALQAQKAYASSPIEESQNRLTNHAKPQPLRRTLRSQLDHRFGDKVVPASDVIWAPVRTKNKAEDSVEATQKSTVESAILSKSDNVAQNNLKGIRAEFGSSIPKPVAKELAQQRSISPFSSSISSSKSDEALGTGQCVSSQSPLPLSSASRLVGSNVEIKEGGGKHKKHRKEHGQWRQRGTTYSSHMKGMHIGPSPISEPTKGIQQPMEQNQSMKCEKDLANVEIKTSGNIDTSGWSDVSNNTTAGGLKGSSAKDQGATGRGKRHVPRGPRSIEYNPDHKSIISGETDGSCVQSAATDNLSDRTVASKASRSFGEQTSSHWQPKSHSSSTISQHGNKIAGSEPVNMEMNKLSAKDRPQRKVQVPHRHDKESSKSVAESNVTIESVVAHHQESNREKKAAPTKGRPYSPNLDPVDSMEPASAANLNVQQERNMSFDSMRNISQNRHSARGQESRGDWSSWQNNRPYNVPAFRGRQKQNSHYEYQPVGSSKDGKPEKLEEPADGGQRYRERGQNHPKRGGNSYRRQSGVVRMNSGQD